MDVIHALDLLTEDCWREVFKKAWGPEDLKSCSEVCTTFEGILFEKRNVWMFPTILPHVLPYLRDTNPPGQRPHRHSWILLRNWSPLYTCRLVCQGWCQSIDHYLETYNNRFRGYKGPTDYNYSFEFGMPFNFAETFETHVRNPFIGRFMGIDNVGMLTPPRVEGNGDLRTTYTENVLRILGRFGNGIRSLSMSMEGILGPESDHLTFCKNIQILLGMLPNLKSLQLGEGYYYQATPDQLEHIYEQDGVDQLPAFLAANPLPDHPKLKHLAADVLSTRMARPLLEKYAPQLTRLELYNAEAFVAAVQRFRCLKQLEIRSFGPQDSLPSLRQLQSPLETLHIWIQYYSQTTPWPIDELIRNIQHLPVMELHISTWAYLESKLDSFPAPLQHGTIRRVRITSQTGRRLSCNFLRCFPNLEEVHFEYMLGHIPLPSGHEDFLIVSNDKEHMYELPIWDILPRLQIITVLKSSHPQFRKYRRSTFEMRRLEKTKEILATLFQKLDE